MPAANRPSNPLQRLVAAVGEGLTQLRALPAWFRYVARLGVVAALGLGPIAVVSTWLIVGTITEAWPWLLWGGGYLELADRLLNIGRPVVFVALLVVAWWLLGYVIEPRRPRRPWGVARVALIAPKLLAFVLVAVCVVALTPLTLVNGVRFVRTWPPRTNHLLLENCGHCHSPYRPQHYVKSPDMWRRTVRRMIERNEAPVDDATAEKIITWLQDYRGFSDEWMFRAKCERCHARTHLLETPRTAEEWDRIVDRLGWVSTFGYRVDQKDQIKRFLTAEMSVEPPAEGTTERVAYDQRIALQNACTHCHSVSLILEDGVLDDTRALVERMARKDPVQIPKEDIDGLIEAIEAQPLDEDAWWRLFPHDILLDLR